MKLLEFPRACSFVRASSFPRFHPSACQQALLLSREREEILSQRVIVLEARAEKAADLAVSELGNQASQNFSSLHGQSDTARVTLQDLNRGPKEWGPRLEDRVASLSDELAQRAMAEENATRAKMAAESKCNRLKEARALV